MAKLTGFRLLSFDVYGTLIDWESGILNGLKPLYYKHVSPERGQALELYHDLETEQQLKFPAMPYSQVLAAIYPQFATKSGLEPPTVEESERFGQSVGQWPQPSPTRLTPSGGFQSTTHSSFSRTWTGNPFLPAQPAHLKDSGSTKSSQRRTSGPTSLTTGISNIC